MYKMEDIKNINNLYSEKKKRVFLTLRHLLTKEAYVNKNLHQAGIVCVVDGAGSLVFENGDKLSLSSNDCFLYDKERAFSIDFEVPTEIFILHFNFSDFIDGQYVITEKETIGTFLSFLKKSCDKINGWHINAKRIQEMLFEIENEIEKIIGINGFDTSAAVISNLRQLSCAQSAKNHLESALNSLKLGVTLDAVGVCVQSAIESLYELSGESASETVIDRVFENFCVGK